ncbi:helix-turn-helix transcriptional regulator [Escherichia coli]
MHENRIRTDSFIILHAHRSPVTIQYNDSEIVIRKGYFALLEKHICVTLKVESEFSHEKTPYEIMWLDKREVENVLKIMDPVYNIESQRFEDGSVTEDGISVIKDDYIANLLFYKIKSNKNERLKMYELAYLFSMSDEPGKVYISLTRSAGVYFCDVVREFVENDTKRKWQLSHLSHSMNLSEVTIRKRLKRENTNFCQILLDVRMQKAARLILKNDIPVNVIAKMVGISSISYFTKLFCSYYGVTPKKYSIKNKRITLNNQVMKKQ